MHPIGAATNKNALSQLTEFDISMRFLSLLFDHPIGLTGMNVLHQVEGIKCEWVRTQPDGTAKHLIPDGQLRVQFSREDGSWGLLHTLVRACFSNLHVVESFN
jgi:hypothetical protein